MRHGHLSVPVYAWQYLGDGAIPEGAQQTMTDVKAHHVSGEATRGMVFLAEALGREPPTRRDYLYWFDCGANQRCGVGDWIVQHEYGVEAMSDADVQRLITWE